MILRYNGGKIKAAPLLKSLLPLDYKEYREPFVGGGALFAKIDPSIKRWINDVDPGVVQVYRELKRNPRFVEHILTLKNKLETADDVHREFQLAKLDFGIDGDPLAMVCLNRYAFGQFVKREQRRNIASCSFHHLRNGMKPLTRERLTKARELMRRTRITCGDYGDLLEAPGVDVAIYLDPPYWLSNSVHGQPLYQYDLSEQNYYELEERLRACRHQWLLTLGDDELTYRLFIRPGRWNIFRRGYRASGVIRKKQPRKREIIIAKY